VTIVDFYNTELGRIKTAEHCIDSILRMASIIDHIEILTHMLEECNMWMLAWTSEAGSTPAQGTRLDDNVRFYINTTWAALLVSQTGA